ncbi:MAG: hypothetical protein HZC55_15020 [Verrucomicrobia bacterium]|nr:hypothetical protein [Verrucomicrobiota bacterium]
MADPDQLPVFHVVGFTGHRQLRDPAAVERTLGEVLGGLRAEEGVEWLALSSIAEGADMLFARTALRLGLGWEAVLPLSPAEFRADFDPARWREVETLLAEAEHARVIGERTAREDAYLDCGMETVNHCDVLLAVWNGEPSRGRGGTAEIVAYAREMGRPVIIIDANDLSVRRENFDRLKVGDRHLAYFNQLPTSPRAPVHDSPDRGRSLVQDFQAKVDHAATSHAPHDRRLVAITLWLHTAATMLATAGLAFPVPLAGLPWLKLSCLLVAIGVALLVRHRREQHKWVRCRLAAEITRSALATWGLPRSLRLFDDFDWAGLEPLRRSLDILHRRGARAQAASFDEFKQRYLHERIDGQLAYFAARQQEAVPVLERLRWGFFVCSLLALCFTAAHASHTALPELAAPAWVETWVYAFGPVVLPVLAATFISLIHVHDLHRRVARYRELQVRLTAARREAAFVQTWGALERVVAKAERALLQEVFEWHSITSFSETH